MIKLPSKSFGIQPSLGKMFGNKDENKKYEFPLSWKDMLIIRESVVSKVGPSDNDVIEIPSSVIIKPFDPSLFNTHVERGMFEHKKIEILHDPR